MNEERNKRISKFLSKFLRHEPEGLGLTLEVGGWVNVDDLMAGCRQKNFYFTMEELEHVVATNNKKRFSFSEDKKKIRANQGHSVEVDLELTPTEPPAQLYHGTATRFLSSILAQGLKSQSRNHVHLSADTATAVNVGQRHGKPVVLIINAQKMHEDGHKFYISDNGVWLTEHVPVTYIVLAESGKA